MTEPTSEKGDDRTSAVRRYFGAAAENYATSPVHVGGANLDTMVALAGLRGDERVLDVGCGAGHTALAFAPRVASVVALDLTPAMLDTTARLASERGLTNVSVRLGAAEALPFPDASFDVVTSRVCAHHYADPVRATREAARVLRSGGLYLLADTIVPDDPAADTFVNAIELLRDPSHVRDYSAAQWLAMFRAAGLDARLAGDFPLRIEFEPWLVRIGTSEQAGAMLRTLLRTAPAEVRAVLELAPESGFDFTLPSALVVGRK